MGRYASRPICSNPTRDGHEALEAVDADNAARKIIIDDGRTSNWGTGELESVRNGVSIPYISPTNPVRTGADVTLVQPAVLDQFRSDWRLQPVEPVIDVPPTITMAVSSSNLRIIGL